MSYLRPLLLAGAVLTAAGGGVVAIGGGLLGVAAASRNGDSAKTTLPLRVHVLTSSVTDLDAASVVDDGDIAARLKQINTMFAPAGIRFQLERIQVDKPANTVPFEEVASGGRKQPVLEALVKPADLIAPRGFDLYVARNLAPLDMGGAYRCSMSGDEKGPGAAFIGFQAANRREQPIRKWTHELGHALSLGHTPCLPEYADNLMMSGKCKHASAGRSKLEPSQIAKIQQQAATGQPAACKRGVAE